MHKIYMARKVNWTVIWPSFENKTAIISHLKWDYPIKKAYISLIIATRGSKCENNLKSRSETLFQLLTFTFDPFFNVKWGYLTTKASYLL